MTRRRRIQLKCPTCGNPVKSGDEDFPFCGGRCRLIDLGKWANGDYVIRGPAREVSQARDRSDTNDEE